MNINDASRDPVIVAAARTPVGKAKRGSLATVRPDDMAVAVIKELLNRAEGLKPEDVNDVILGCAFPRGRTGAEHVSFGSVTGWFTGYCSSRDD